MQQSNPQSFEKITTLYISIAGVIFMFIFGVLALSHHQDTLGIALLGFMALGLASVILMLKTNNTAIGQNGASAVSFFIIIYLIYNGGTEGTGALWGFPLLLIVIILQGFKRGLIAVGLILMAAASIFYGNIADSFTYDSTFKSRYIATFIATATMALIYEYHREKTEQQAAEANQALMLASNQDPLTSLLNRRAALTELKRLFSSYQRHGSIFSVIMIDLDYFKELNDTYGHNVGDKVLIEAANTITNHTRNDDYVIRWGGEEFIVILPNTNLNQAHVSAEKLRTKITEIKIDGLADNFKLSASLGVQSIAESNSIDDLVHEADTKLYAAKEAGRNQVIS